MTPGRFIVFEGLDGSGKSTQAERLRSSLVRAGRTVHLTCEPTDGPIGALLRHYLAGRLTLSESALPYVFAADRADHVYDATRGILALLKSGTDVICDRYVFSSLAYQATESNRTLVEALNSAFLAPDITIYLDIRPEDGLDAKGKQSRVRDKNDTLEKQSLVASAYSGALLSPLAHAHRVVKVAARPRTPEAIASEILSLVERL